MKRHTLCTNSAKPADKQTAYTHTHDTDKVPALTVRFKSQRTKRQQRFSLWRDSSFIVSSRNNRRLTDCSLNSPPIQCKQSVMYVYRHAPFKFKLDTATTSGRYSCIGLQPVTTPVASVSRGDSFALPAENDAGVGLTRHHALTACCCNTPAMSQHRLLSALRSH